MAESGLEESVVTADQVESSPSGVLKRWLAELDLAAEAEKDWRDKAEGNWKLYKSEKGTESTFNILWSNTETLRPALYNSLPQPDVRRRFRDKNPTARVGSEVLERSLKYQIDSYDFDYAIQHVVLDVLIPGRGGARIVYEPKFREQPGAEADPLTGEIPEEISAETALCKHFAWDDFRRGPGKTWDEVPWVAFRHHMPREQLVEMFGKDIGNAVKLTDMEKSEKVYDKEIRTLLKTACIWEVWDKSKRRVLFLAESYKAGPLREVTDPLRLGGFFPMPRPVYAIEDTTSLIPQPLYQKYEVQARELNKVSVRIDKVVAALKIRGAYASNLSELATIIEADDNQMVPIVNASEVAAMGGLDKAIWIMPIDKLAGVLEDLYTARQQTMQTIYEITGLGDIMRGVSNPHETLGAQQLKSQWGTLRLQKMQREVQRFIRDLMRLKAEIIAEHFQMETLQSITGIELPTDEDKAKLQQMQQQAQMSGQQIPPEVMAEGQKTLATPTWLEVMELLKSDEMRRFSIGIETDSTIAETLTRDAQGMQEAITAVVNVANGLAPAIESGALDIEVAKTMMLAMARQSRMGDAVEEAIDQMKQPPPPPPPPPDPSIEVTQIKTQSDQQIAMAKEQGAAALAAAEQQHQQQLEMVKAQSEQIKLEAQTQADMSKLEADARTKQIEAAAKASIAQATEAAKAETIRVKAESDARIAAANAAASLMEAKMVEGMKAETKRESDQLNAAVKIIVAQMSAMKGGEGEDGAKPKPVDEGKVLAALEQVLTQLQQNSGPKKFAFEMDDDGNVVGATSQAMLSEE